MSANRTLFAVVDDGGRVVDIFTSECPVSFPDDVPASVDPHLSPNALYTVYQVGMLTPVVGFVAATDAPETNHENDDSAPSTPVAPAKSKSVK